MPSDAEPAELAIREATSADIARMTEIEVDAGQMFAEIGMQSVADDPPPSTEQYLVHIANRSAWVAVEAESGSVMGYALASKVDGLGHLNQVSVARGDQNRGIGRALIEAVCDWVDRHDFGALTLTTFSDVGFNAPLYRHLGFDEIPRAEIGPELAEIVKGEKETLGAWPRVVMRLKLPTNPA